MSILLKIIIYGLLIPFIVILLSVLGMEYLDNDARNSFGSEYKLEYSIYMHEHGFDPMGLSIMVYPPIYYIFCILFFLIKKQTMRKWIVAIFLIIPMMLFIILIVKDSYNAFLYKVNGMLYLAYYILFFLFRCFLFLTSRLLNGRKELTLS